MASAPEMISIELLGDGGLRAVHLQSQFLDHFAGEARRGVHRRHLRAEEARGVLQQDAEDLDSEVCAAGDRPGRYAPRVPDKFKPRSSPFSLIPPKVRESFRSAYHYIVISRTQQWKYASGLPDQMQ